MTNNLNSTDKRSRIGFIACNWGKFNFFNAWIIAVCCKVQSSQQDKVVFWLCVAKRTLCLSSSLVTKKKVVAEV